MVASVAMPSPVNSIQHMPVNNVVGYYPSAMLTPSTFPLPVDPYVCLLPEIRFPVHQNVSSENFQTQTCQATRVPDHRSSQDGNRFVHDSRTSGEDRVIETRIREPLLQQPAHERWSSDRLDDTSYREKVLDDDISRERLEKQLMKEKIEQWKIRDGIDSDMVEFERLRTPHRYIVDAGMFITRLH